MKTGFFEEAPGVKSSIRLQMFLTLIFAFLIIGYQVYKKDGADFELALLLLSAAFVPKVISKFAEIKAEAISEKK